MKENAYGGQGAELNYARRVYASPAYDVYAIDKRRNYEYKSTTLDDSRSQCSRKIHTKQAGEDTRCRWKRLRAGSRRQKREEAIFADGLDARAGRSHASARETARNVNEGKWRPVYGARKTYARDFLREARASNRANERASKNPCEELRVICIRQVYVESRQKPPPRNLRASVIPPTSD